MPASPTWVVNFESTPEHNAPAAESDTIATLRKFTYLAVKGYVGEWAEVFNPRTRESGFIPSDAIGPADSPPDYITADPPPAVDEINLAGRALRGAALSFYPTPDPEAQTDTLNHNMPVAIAESVAGEDGETWFRTADGDYVPTSEVRLPRPPVRTFAGRWIDVDLREPAMLVAYDSDRPVLTTLTIHGAGPRPTPLGVFTIGRRMADETMNSDTIGIPRFGPGGYYLQHVLFTQYFTSDGRACTTTTDPLLSASARLLHLGCSRSLRKTPAHGTHPHLFTLWRGSADARPSRDSRH
ncbi:MAG: L,D-transpeptidase [Chloroflexi bacterium]|nr:L,D-transpeptidase [Chloroflexota bacterium]